MRILVTNSVLLNAGDSAIAYGQAKLFRQAFGEDVELILYDKNGDDSSRYYPDLNIRRWLFDKPPQNRTNGGPRPQGSHLRLDISRWLCERNLHVLSKPFLGFVDDADAGYYASADMIASTGGTYLVEHYPQTTRILEYRYSMQVSSNRLVFLPQSMGPFTRSDYRRVFKDIFDRSFLILRDARSEKYVRHLGVRHGDVHVTADSAFALAEPPVLEAAKRRPAIRSSPKVVISVREWAKYSSVSSEMGTENYFRAIRGVTAYLVRELGARITYISTCQGMPEYWTDDSKVAEKIASGLPADVMAAVTVDKEFRRPPELIATLKGFDLVIATRMHLAILSLVSGVAAIGIAYEFKTRDLFETLGVPQLVHDIDTVTAEALVRSVEAYRENTGEINHQMFSGVHRLHESAMSSADLLKLAASRI
ncbi:MAG: polysaccharide pyruvyl transferase family protein [Bryobacteraceae bacterium]